VEKEVRTDGGDFYFATSREDRRGQDRCGRKSGCGIRRNRAMSDIDSEALAGLTAAVEALLPAAPDPSVRFFPLVAPMHLAPTGLGGFVGTNEDPEGEIFGRRLKAMVQTGIEGNSVDPVNDAVAAVTSAFLGADRAELLEQGLIRITLEDIGDQLVSGSGANRVVRRSLTFEVLYEFLKIPEEPEEAIEEIPINLDTEIPVDLETP